MLPIATKIGRCRPLSQCSLIINSKCEPSLSRGYVKKYPVNKYINKIKNEFYHVTIAPYSSNENDTNSLQHELDSVEYERIANNTLESLTEYFDELVEEAEHLKEADVNYGDGVLTVKFGNKYGTYVINRQTPNKQIWLSSPTSGPKRYDFIDGTWIYKHDRISLHELLDKEIPSIIKNTTLFNKCAYSKKI